MLQEWRGSWDVWLRFIGLPYQNPDDTAVLPPKADIRWVAGFSKGVPKYNSADCTERNDPNAVPSFANWFWADVSTT